jgi:hypothetical protein
MFDPMASRESELCRLDSSGFVSSQCDAHRALWERKRDPENSLVKVNNAAGHCTAPNSTATAMKKVSDNASEILSANSNAESLAGTRTKCLA